MNKMCIFFFVVCFSFCSVETVDAIAVVVEDTVVLTSEIVQQSLYIASEQNINPYDNPGEFDLIYAKVLNRLVDNLILYDLAKKDTTVVVDELLVEERLQEELKRRVDIVGSVSALEKMFGEPLSMIRAKLRKELNKSFLIELYTSSFYSSASPSLSDVRFFYQENKDSLPFLGERVDISILEWAVVFEKEKEAAVMVFLENLKDSVLLGFSFSDLASRHSDDVYSSKNGGSLGYTERETLFSEYENVAYGLGVGEVGGPFVSPVGYHLVLLEDRLGEKIKTSHILKRTELDQADFKASLEIFQGFLSELNVYNSVGTFDSLCAHHNKREGSFQGVFKSFFVKDLPAFVPDSVLSSFGFSPFLTEKNKLYIVRISKKFPAEKVTLENSYSNLFLMAQTQLLYKKIQEVIKNHSEKIYIKRFH